MTHPRYANALDLMEKTGGSFAQALVRAMYVADQTNRYRLRRAFDDLFRKYEDQFAAYINQGDGHE